MPRPNPGPRLKWLKERQCWYIIWYEAGRRKVRSTGTTDYKRAEAILATFLGKRGSNAGPRDPNEVTIAEALNYYGQHKAPKATDPARIGYAIDALLTFWELNALSDITPSTCDAYARHRGKSAGTIRRELATLTAAQNFMLKDGALTRTVPVPLPEKPEPKDRWLTRDEAARLLIAARNGGRETRLYLPLFILIALHTGARKEAVLSLRWPQIDFERERISFEIPGRRKTKKRRPTLPIPRRLMTFLRYAWVRRSSDIGPVVHLNGLPIKRIDKGFRAAAKRAELDGVTPHTLRHTRGTWLAQAGVSMWDIAGWLGQDPETTARIYAHHSPDFMLSARAAVDGR